MRRQRMKFFNLKTYINSRKNGMKNEKESLLKRNKQEIGEKMET